MTDVQNGPVHALSGAYVVDALDDAERAAFEQHLPGCHDCQVEVAGLRETAALLADSAALAPPESMRANVLAGIRTIRPLPPAENHPGSGNVVPMRPRRFRLLTLAVAAAVLAVLGFAAVSQPWRDTGLSRVDRVMAAGDATHVKVTLADGSTATVVRSVSEDKAVIVTENMAKAPEGKVYELWLRNPQGIMLPAGLMEGSGDHKQLLTGDAADATAAAISVEPSGGSRSPTTEPIALFDFEKA